MKHSTMWFMGGAAVAAVASVMLMLHDGTPTILDLALFAAALAAIVIGTMIWAREKWNFTQSTLWGLAAAMLGGIGFVISTYAGYRDSLVVLLWLAAAGCAFVAFLIFVREKRGLQVCLALTLVGIGGTLSACANDQEVVNYRTYTDPQRGIFYIYDGIIDRAALISGVGTSQTRVVITRQAN